MNWILLWVAISEWCGLGCKWHPGRVALPHQATKCFVTSRICVFTPVQWCWRMVYLWWSPPMILAFGALKVSPTTFGRRFCRELLTCDHHMTIMSSYFVHADLSRFNCLTHQWKDFIAWQEPMLYILYTLYRCTIMSLRDMFVLFLHCEATVAWQLNTRDLKTLAKNSKLCRHSLPEHCEIVAPSFEQCQNSVNPRTSVFKLTSYPVTLCNYETSLYIVLDITEFVSGHVVVQKSAFAKAQLVFGFLQPSYQQSLRALHACSDDMIHVYCRQCTYPCHHKFPTVFHKWVE